MSPSGQMLLERLGMLGSSGLADLPEEEQRMSLRQFHAQQFTLISVDLGWNPNPKRTRNCLGVSVIANPNSGGYVHSGKETCLRQRNHRKPQGQKDVVCISLSVLLLLGIVELFQHVLMLLVFFCAKCAMLFHINIAFVLLRITARSGSLVQHAEVPSLHSLECLSASADRAPWGGTPAAPR